MVSSLPPQPIARFADDLIALAPGMERLGVAVSGGPDSLALLLLAAAAFPGRVSAATVDHGLRPGSDDEARAVGAICKALGVPHQILTVDVDIGAPSLQQAARRARYGALGDWMTLEGLGILATAHHLDDQAETLLMRLMRGAGVAGLSGVRACAPLPGHQTPVVVRPLLGWRKAELIELVAAAGLRAVDDPSNRDPRFDRTLVRTRLSDQPWLDPVALARSAAALADADQALVWAADAAYALRVWAEDGRTLFNPADLPREIRRRIFLRVIGEIAPDSSPRGHEVDRLLTRLEQGATGTLGRVKVTGGADWRFERVPPRRKGAPPDSGGSCL